jgi:hypothetical protein
MGILLLLLFFLIGFILFIPQPIFPFIEYVYPIIAIIVLSIFGARGRYDFPNPLQYILIFGIALIPILGTLYVAYYAGVNIARYRILTYSLSSMLLLITLLIALNEVDIESINRLAQNLESITPKPEASSTPSITSTSTRTTKPSPTNSVIVSPTPASSPPPEDCFLWSEITADHVGQEMCIYGEYQEIHERDDGTHVMAFSDEPGTFNIWSNPKPMWWYLESIEGNCIMIKGEVMTSGVRPMILLGSRDILEPCP